MTRIRLLHRLTPGLVSISFDGDQAMWTKATARKESECALSHRRIRPGLAVYRPFGNQMYRSARIRADALEGLEAPSSREVGR